ncbi:beta-ketoacyl-[acyl-carrier-protein] synthase family protein [Shewanella psychrotolerans]|uniref:beta-ketoacyl-[acyl-carrier-protein] synthase family protein n=1 Tax=Shewanella psychrotolerans TaxID=2864206 RepID=UPI001C656A14|nr:beta-ketoacyl-[acyl-carrier-protein] synthase family protein [Shewanella psychrotolerans]QYK01702.1 beta-ketoacyl-[acyl-carrier-protein] synthase family protein [Shewanella psychrotolerans]
MTEIAITHLGLCTPLGQTPEQVLPHLLDGNTDGMQWRSDLIPNTQVLVGQVNAILPDIPERFKRFRCRNNQLLLAAIQQIEQQVELAKTQFGPDRIGIILGTSTSGIAKGENALTYRMEHGVLPDDYLYSKQELGNSCDFLKHYFELSGPCYTVSTACSSSAKVFASAKRLLNAGICDMVIVGGADSLCKLTLNGFHSLESISKGHCQPFSINRDGINIGEGAALFTLVRGKSEIMLAGVGESSDAHHISAPHPEGTGAITAIEMALKDANIDANQIDYINLHGTATMKNDAMESRALAKVFGQSLPMMSSTKPLSGHALGAAGAIEAAFCFLLLSKLNVTGRMPPQLGDHLWDENNPPLPFVQSNMHTKLNYIMSNSFAFGGSNASVIFCRATI